MHQVLCSACSLDYGQGSTLLFKMPLARDRAKLWEPLARLVLEAAYEATLLAALRQGSRVVFLTLLGGGVFKNDVRHSYFLGLRARVSLTIRGRTLGRLDRGCDCPCAGLGATLPPRGPHLVL